MRVEAVGLRGGQRTRLQWDLHDRYDAASRCTSMSRTTAFPCAIVARMILEGAVPSAGVWVPERLGQVAGVTERVMAELERRGVRYAHRAAPV
jgi:saccharopine dehydrogenase-like NADP-dependent oxidoreductase